MLNFVNGKIPNNLRELLIEKNLTIADTVRMSGLSRPTVTKLIEGNDSYISKIAKFCDSLGLSLSTVYGSQSSIHQEVHSHDHSNPSTIGYQVVQGNIDSDEKSLRQRITDLEKVIETQDKLLSTQEKLINELEKNKEA